MTEDNTLRCSFCGKPQHEAVKLVAGPAVFICDECIDLCCGIMIMDSTTIQEIRNMKTIIESVKLSDEDFEGLDTWLQMKNLIQETIATSIQERNTTAIDAYKNMSDLLQEHQKSPYSWAALTKKYELEHTDDENTVLHFHKKNRELRVLKSS